jgi:hypothetical protein
MNVYCTIFCILFKKNRINVNFLYCCLLLIIVYIEKYIKKRVVQILHLKF